MSRCKFKKNLSHVLCASALLSLGGCWIDGSTGVDAPAPAPAPSPQGVTVNGAVYAANVNGSAVAMYAADVNGKPSGAALATATTDANGRYALSLSSVPAGPVIIVASGGSYVSEADGTPQTLGTLSTLLASLSVGANVAQIDPLTSTIAAAASNLLAQGGTSVGAAIGNARTRVTALFGLSTLVGDPNTVAADPNATSGDAWLVAALAGTLEQLRSGNLLAAGALYQALQDDVADGKLDGLSNGQPIALPGGGTLTASLFTTEWSGAATAYGAAHPVYAAATALISGALQSSAQTAGVAIGSSGSIAPLQTQSGGTQIYFAARGDGLVQLDMRDPKHPAASKVAAINAAVMKSGNSGYFTSLDGIVIDPTPIGTPHGAKVFAILYSYNSKTVVAVNLTDGVVADAATLSITNTNNFSGARAAIAGGIADGKRGKVWLATGDGLLGVDPSNLQAAPVSIAQPAGTQINENLGGDPSNDIVYTPDYRDQTLVIFNLAEGKAYTMDNTAWQQLTNGWSASEVDGVALDAGYHVAVMTPEGGSAAGLLTYSTPSGSPNPVGTIPSGATFKTFTTGGGSYSGSAIDGLSHTALFVGEGSGLGVGVIDDPANANWKGFSSFVATSYGASSYRFEPHDPHTVGAFSIGGNPYGFLLQGSYSGYQVVVLDLKAFLATPTTNGVANTDPLADPGIATLLSY